jgi:hypothetical protein
MPKRTVFYSWQSDTPSSINRGFIEKALHGALKRLKTDTALESALRDTEIDKDTQGIAGSPPIVETILRKIEECAVFVADLTFTGYSHYTLVAHGDTPRLFPNPNVLIEYGYALKCHGYGRIIGVMNGAFGKPDYTTLPFDLRHLRWPICYDLPDPLDPRKASELEKLIETLAAALRPMLQDSTTAQNGTGRNALRNLADEAAEDRYDSSIRHTEEGVIAVHDSVKTIVSSITKQVQAATSGQSIFEIRHRDYDGFHPILIIHGPKRVSGFVHLEVASNSSDSAALRIHFFLRGDQFTEPQARRELEQRIWHPRFPKKGVVLWQKEGGGEVHAAEQIADDFCIALTQHVRNAS